ncbi:hypothetical protein CEXT_396561 [Caerostris extrusa]|uniref:Uncharacterized protein n=1 Tax=Caerostris extrusa TaxID=172846 RepID=A0AAV4YCH9_CAEEX|nr:hypothetical protein CEXT_396561 [Caerostris extrusa]
MSFLGIYFDFFRLQVLYLFPRCYGYPPPSSVRGERGMVDKETIRRLRTTAVSWRNVGHVLWNLSGIDLVFLVRSLRMKEVNLSADHPQE